MSDLRDTAKIYPTRPEEPLDSDCCGSGCTPCIFDIHADNLKKWRRKCDEITNNSINILNETHTKHNSLSQVRYSPFRLEKITNNTRDVNVYTFQAVEIVEKSVVMIHDALDLRVGQHLIMKGITKEGKNISRAYTPISDISGCFDILVKLYTEGEMSRYFSSLSVGDISHFRGPYGDFTYRPNSFRKVLLLCAGTGLAPLYRIAKTIVENETDETFVRLLYSVRSLNDVILRDELRAMKENWNFTAVVHVTGDNEDGRQECGPRYGENVVHGRIAEDAIKSEMIEKRDDVLVLICGTTSFNNDMSLYVKNLGCRVHVF